MHRKIKSRARQTRRHQKKPLAMAQKTNALSIRRLKQAHREEVMGLRHTLYQIKHHDSLEMMNYLAKIKENLTEAVDQLTAEIQSLKRILHGYAVIGANTTINPSIDKPAE